MADSDTLQQDVALFTSVVDSKRNALGVTTQQKKNTLGLPDLGEVRAIPEFNFEGSSIPSLEDSEREYQKSRSYYNLKNDTALFSENAFEKGVKYFGNIAGAGIAGVGHLDNLVLSSPNIVSNLLAPADKALGQFVADTVPSFNRAVAPVFNKFFGDPAKAALQGADELGDLIQEGTGYFYNDRNVQKLSQQLTDNYNDNTGIADVVVNMAGTVGSNIHALPEVVANSYSIMMAMAAKGSILASTFIGSMGERMEQSITLYKDSHDGQLPTGNAYNTILVANAVGTAVELIESRFLLGKKIKLKQALAEKSGRLGTAISKVPFVNTVAALGTGTIAESGEEFTAEYLSKASGLQDKLTGLLDDRVVGPSAVNAAIGAGAGGAIKTAHSVPSDTGKLAKSGIDATAKFVERKIAVNTEKRKKSAAEAEDFLELAEINLEKDLTTFSNAEDRMAHIKETLVNLSKANNQRESLDGKEAEEADARILEMQKKLKAVITIHSELKAVEESATTVAEAEKRIVSAVEDTVDSRDAINTVVSAIDEGRDVTSNIVKTIRGSTIFSDLPKATQEKIELQDEFNDINITRPIGEKSLAEVAADIATGSTKEKFIGLSQHRQNVTLAIAAEDYKAAKLTLQQLKGLRDRINEKLSSRSTQPNQPSYATGSHSPGFIKQLSQEIKDLSTAMRLFDSNVKEKFGESPLTEADLRTPDIKPYKGDTSKSKPVTEAKEPAKDIEKPTTVKPKVTLASVKSQTVERIKKIKNTATKNILLVEVNKVKGKATKSNIKTLRDIYNRANEAIKVEGGSSTKTEVKEKGKQKTVVKPKSETKSVDTPKLTLAQAKNKIVTRIKLKLKSTATRNTLLNKINKVKGEATEANLKVLKSIDSEVNKAIKAENPSSTKVKPPIHAKGELGSSTYTEEQDVEFVFNSVKGLKAIGSLEQYKQYIKNIMNGLIPNEHGIVYRDNKIQSILYHGTGYKFDIFSKDKLSTDDSIDSYYGFFFTNNYDSTYQYIIQKIAYELQLKIVYLDALYRKDSEEVAKFREELKILDTNFLNKVDGLNSKERNKLESEIRDDFDFVTGNSLLNKLSNFNETIVTAKILKNAIDNLPSTLVDKEIFYKDSKGKYDTLYLNGTTTESTIFGNVDLKDIPKKELLILLDNAIKNTTTDIKELTTRLKELGATPKVLRTLVYSKNPTTKDFKGKGFVADSLGPDIISFLKEKFVGNADAAILANLKDPLRMDSYIIPTPEQVHILGSKGDLAAFSNFVSADKSSKQTDVKPTKVKEETKTKKDEVIKPRQTDLGLTGENPEKIKAFDSKGKIDTQILKLKKELSLLEQQLTDISKLINKTLKDNINVQQFLQSIGGLNRKDWSVTDVDKSFFKLKIGGSKPLFPVSGGKTVNEIREEFNSESYKNNSDWTDAEVVEEVLTILNGEVELLDPNAQAEIINLYEGQNEVSEEIDKVTANIVDLKTQRAAIDTEVKEETEAENDSSTKTVPSVAKKESKEVKQKVVKDTETTAKPVKTVFIPVPAFNAILDMEIPDTEKYEGIKKLEAKPHKAAVRTYKDMIIKQDDILRALQTMIRECNV